MSATADIAGIYREWEDVHALRQQVWQHGNLFRDHNAADSPSINVKTAIMNFDALLPLVKRLGTRDGDVLMTTIPDLKREFLRFNCKPFNVLHFFPTYGNLLEPKPPDHRYCYRVTVYV